MDKRNQKKRNRCLCWGVFLSIIAAAVIVGILAAGKNPRFDDQIKVTNCCFEAGVIGPQEAHPVNAREFGSAHPEPEAELKTGGLFNSGAVSSSTTEAEDDTKRYTPGPPSSTVPSIPPSTETSMIEGSLPLIKQTLVLILMF